MTYMLLLNCALKLVEEIILYYDARSKKHQSTVIVENSDNFIRSVQHSAVFTSDELEECQDYETPSGS